MLEPADNGAIAEEHFLRGYRLWTQRHIPIAWPVEPRGYTFLGNAVHLVGAALFPDWTGEEPAEFHLPALERGTLQEASENKRGFAKAILLKFDREAVRDGGRFDLSIAEWERAIALYSVNVFPNIAAARRKMVKLMRVIVDGAAHQKLFMVTRNQFGLPVASSPSEWATEWAYALQNAVMMREAIGDTDAAADLFWKAQDCLRKAAEAMQKGVEFAAGITREAATAPRADQTLH